MPRKPKDKRFATEAEEAAWWEANEEALAERFEKVAGKGGTPGCILVVTGDSTVAKVRLGSKDLARARVQAAKHGLRCQQYLKLALHEALLKAESEGEPTVS